MINDVEKLGHVRDDTNPPPSEESTTTCQTHSNGKTPSASTFSEGDLKGVLAVIGAFFALLCTFGQLNAFGTFQSWYAAHQLVGHSPSTISWIGSLQLWMFFFSGGAIGRVFDAHGPRALMITGTTCYVFSLMMMSISTKYYQYILSQGLLFGLGVGLIFYPCMASVSTHFFKYRGTALGIVASGSSVGGVIWPIAFQRLFERMGFAWGVRICGLVSGLCCCISILMVSRSSLGLKESDVFANEEKKECLPVGRLWQDAPFVLLALGSGCVALGVFIPYFYINVHAHSLSASHASTYTLAILNAGGIFGRIAPAYLADALGRFNLLFPSALFSGLSCLLFWMFAKSLVALMIFGATYGFFSGAFISVITPCVAQISDIREIGIRIGILYTFLSFPSLVGGPVGGALLTHHKGSFTSIILFSGATLVTGSLFILTSRFMVDSRILVKV